MSPLPVGVGEAGSDSPDIIRRASYIYALEPRDYSYKLEGRDYGIVLAPEDSFMKVVPPKDPAETPALAWDFTSLMDADEVVAVNSPVVSVTVMIGQDPAPDNIKSGNPVVDAAGKVVTQGTAGGSLNTMYRLTCQVLTSKNKVWTGAIVMAVQAA